MECKNCGNGLLEHIEAGESEVWACDSCDTTVIVPVTIERHFDAIDWSCAND